jgi:hypothetical protein
VAGDGVDGLDQRVGADVFEQEAAGPGPQGVEQVLVVVEGREHQHTGRGVGRRDDPSGRLEAVEQWHADVHQHHVGSGAGRRLDRLEAVGRLGHDRQVGLVVEDLA